MRIWRCVFKSTKQKQGKKKQTCTEVMEWFQLKFRDDKSWPHMKEDAISCIISWDGFCAFIINSTEAPRGTGDREIQLGPQAEVNQCVIIAPKTSGVPPFCLFICLLLSLEKYPTWKSICYLQPVILCKCRKGRGPTEGMRQATPWTDGQSLNGQLIQKSLVKLRRMQKLRQNG